jgi:hypothetical protein
MPAIAAAGQPRRKRRFAWRRPRKPWRHTMSVKSKGTSEIIQKGPQRSERDQYRRNNTFPNTSGDLGKKRGESMQECTIGCQCC